MERAARAYRFVKTGISFVFRAAGKGKDRPDTGERSPKKSPGPLAEIGFSLRHKLGIKMNRARRISWRKVFCGLLALTLLFSGGCISYVYRLGYGYVLKVDGREIAFLYEEDRETIESFSRELTSKASMNYHAQAEIDQDISFSRERRPGEHTEAGIVQDELHQLISFSVYGYVLMVNGMEKAILASEEEYEEVVDIIRGNFVEDNGIATVRRFVIEEEVSFIRTRVTPEALTCVEETANRLLGDSSQRQVYLVSRGDSLYSIARNQNVSLAELKEANPQITDTLIRPGDQLNLDQAVPLVNISVVEEVTTLEKISFETDYVDDDSMWTSETRVIREGSHGEKEVTYLITRENGRETNRRVLKEDVLVEPVTQVVARGTVRKPFESIGRFGWPLPPGVGTLTSPFGWRWGSMHNGIDIGAPVGTAIRAADRGTVATSAYRGSYGNLVIINHSDGYSTYYAHNSRNLVKAGQRVSKGETIALLGSTGNSTGPHVHFEIRRNGKPMDPMRFYRR